MYHVNVNVNLTKEDVIQIKSGIAVNVDVGVKNIKLVKRITFRIILRVIVKIVNI